MNILFGSLLFERLRQKMAPFFKGHKLRASGLADLPQHLPWAEVLVMPPSKVDAALLDRGPRLRLLHQWGTGVEGIDIAACTARDIPLCHVPSRGTGNGESVAELAIMLMMLLSRRWARCQESITAGRLYSPRGKALWKKRACVIGLGNLGRCMVERLEAFGMVVRGVNRTPPKEAVAERLEQWYPLDQLKEAVFSCSFVLLALPVTPETRHIIDAAILASMGPETFLINVARGNLVHREALVEALKKETIAGYGTDVFWDEPANPQDPLLGMPHVIVTPHIGGVTDVAQEGITAYISANVERLCQGKPLLSCINIPQDKADHHEH